jgi:hypothetical protein
MPYKNPEDKLAWRRRYESLNREAVREWHRDWKEKNADRYREKSKIWADKYNQKKEAERSDVEEIIRALRKYAAIYKKNNQDIFRRIANEKSKVYQKKRGRYHLYGITHTEYELMLYLQDDRCAVCNKQFSTSNTPCIDHNHESQQVRGLLCNSCNLGIGLMRESTGLIQRAIEYLKQHGKR